MAVDEQNYRDESYEIEPKPLFGPRYVKGGRLKIASPHAVERRTARQKAQKLARKAQRRARA